MVLAVVGTAANKVSKSLANGEPVGPVPSASHKVGDTARTGDFTVTVFAVKAPQPSSDFTPSDGKQFVSVDVQLTNSTGSQRSFSSLLGLHLLDNENRQYSEAFFPDLEPGPPDGEFAAGQSIRGFVVFEVAGALTGLKLRVQGSLTAAGAVFSLT